MNMEWAVRHGRSRLAPLMLSRYLPQWVDQPLTVAIDGALAAVCVVLLLPAYFILGIALAFTAYLRFAGMLLMR